MKNSKTLLRLCALSVLCALLISLLPSCFLLPEKLRIELLTKQADARFEKASSYTTNITARMQMPIEGTTIDVLATEEAYYHDQSGKNFSYYSKTKTDLSYGGTTTVTEQIEGYHEGKHYLQKNIDDGESKLYAPLSLEEFKERLEEETDDFDDFAPFEDCATVTHSFDEDGSLHSVYEDFTKEGLEQFDDLIAGLKQMLEEGGVLADARIEMVISADGYPEELIMELGYESDDADDLLALKMNCVYSDFNSTKARCPEDLASFILCPDLKLLEDIEEALKQAANAEKGSFSYILRSSSSYLGNNQGATENGTVEFAQVGKNFTHTVKSRSDGYTITLRYENGLRTTKVRNDKTILQEDVTDSTDTVERALVKGLMMPLSFDEMLFESIEKKEDGYLFTLARHANVAELNESVESLGGVYISSDATLFVELQDGDTLKAINYQQTVYFEIEGNNLVSKYSFEMEILE